MKNHSLDQTFFKPKWELKPRLQRYPTRRWGHTAVIKNKKVYIYGGKTGKSKEPLYEIDCDTLQCRSIDLQGSPESRESHSCSVVGDKLFIWGGCRQEKALNDCMSLEFKEEGSCIWNTVPQFPTLNERQSHATAVLKDKYIFLYGGSNDEDIYEDFWVFNTELDIWFEIKNVENRPTKRIGCSINHFSDCVYMFAGENEDGEYNNDLYKISFEHFDFISKENIPKIKFQLLKPKGKSPHPRCSHASIIYQERFIIIIGGEGLSLSKGKQTSTLLNDVWCYDIVENEWSEINIPTQNVLKPRSCFTASLYKNKVIILGGLVSLQNFRSSEELYVLSLTENIERKIDICNLCKLQFANPFEKTIPQKIESAVGNFFNFPIKNLFKLTKLIKNPFDAFCLFLEGFSKKGYKSMNLDYVEGKMIMIQGEGTILDQTKFLNFLTNYDIPEQILYEDPKVEEAYEGRVNSVNMNIFTYNIRNACARLGNTFLLVNTRNKVQDMLLVTLENAFYCQYNIESEDGPVSEADKKSFQIISNYLRSYNLNFILVENNTFNIVITDLRTISPEECELKVVNNHSIELAGTTKRYSLLSYLSTFYLRDPSLKVVINSKELIFHCFEENFPQIPFESQIKNDFLSCKFQESEKDNAIYIYRGNVRVGKYVRRQAPLMEGYVELPFGYELSLLRHKIQNMHAIERCIENMITEYYRQLRKRKPIISVRELQNGFKHSTI